MGNFLNELKRRHVYRIAAAYAVVAWVLLQLVNNIAPILDLPPWVARAFLLALVVGFPITLLVVWLQQLAPADGSAAPVVTGRLDWVLIASLGILIGLVTYQQLVQGAGTGQQARGGPSAANQAGISIAVLPFVNLSDDRQQEFFSDGMTEEITAALAQVPGLRVTGRTSAFEFKGQNKDMRAIAQALGVSHLIEGSVRKAGNRVRITAQLIKADDDSHLWAENFDRDLTDVFSIQEEIATSIAASLRVPLGLQEGRSLVRNRTKDDAAYEDYLRAKALVRARGGRRLAEASVLLEGVVAREPDYAPGWALLGLAYAFTPTFRDSFGDGDLERTRPVIEASLPKSEMAARRAIAIDPKYAGGYSALALVQVVRGKPLLAAEQYAQALALDQDDPDALHGYSLMLVNLGYVKQALAMRQRLQTLEPFVPIFAQISAATLWLNGQDDAAIAMLKSLPQPGFYGAAIAAAQGRYRDAADILETGTIGNYLPEIRERAVQLMRAAPAAAPAAGRLGVLGVVVYPFIGAPLRALDIFEDAHKAGNELIISLFLWARPYEAVRKSARFKAYVRDAGMVEYWRAKGWPDLCRPAGTDDFVCE